MASVTVFSKAVQSRRRSLRRLRTIKADENGAGHGFEVTLPAVESGDVGSSSLNKGISQSHRLVINNLGQCRPLLEEGEVAGSLGRVGGEGVACSNSDSSDSGESLSLDPSGSLFGRLRVSLENRFQEGLWWLKKQSKDKLIDAGEDVLRTYHDSFLYGKVSLAIKVRAGLRGGKWKPLLPWLEFVAAVILIALYVRSTYTSKELNGIATIEYLCALFFIVDYVVKVFCAPVRLYYMLSLTGLVDLVTALPIGYVYSDGIDSPFALCQILLVLRVLRVIPALTAWLVFTSTVGHQIFLLVVNTFGAVFIAAGVFQWVELKATPQSVKDANNCGPMGCFTYYQTLYLMIVTVSTVGYGDLTPKSDWGRVVIGCTILTALVILPVQISKILQLASRRPYGGTFAVRKVIGSRFIIISGNLSYRMVQDFLLEFYHPNHSKDMSAFPLRVVILAPFKPSFELKTLLLHYGGLVEFIEGTPTRESHLDRVSAKVASAFFLLADQNAKDPDAEDAAQVLRTLSVHRYCGSRVRVIVEMLQPDKEASAIWDDAESEIEIICPEAIRFKLLARGCYIKGLSTFVTNLFRSGLSITKWPKTEQGHWMIQYCHGMRQGVFPVILPPTLLGLPFEKAAELMYCRYQVILFGLDVVSEDDAYRTVLVHPRGWVLTSSDVGLVIAKTLAQAEQLSQFGQGRSLHTWFPFLSCLKGNKSSMTTQKSDEELLQEVAMQQGHPEDVQSSHDHVLCVDNPDELKQQLGRMRKSRSGSGGSASSNSMMMQAQSPICPAIVANRLGGQKGCCADDGAGSNPCAPLTLAEAVDRAMSWPPLNKQQKPEPPVLEKREEMIVENLRRSTLGLVSLDKSHILVCIKGDWPLNIFSFVSHLRTSVQPNPAIVILHPDTPTAAEWGCVGMFPDVYFVKGSPVYELDLVRAGVVQAEKVVILTQSKQDQQQEKSTDSEEEGSSSFSSPTFISDVQNVLIAATVERLQQPTRERVITELQDESSIQFLRPKFHINRQRFDQEMYDRNSHASFQYAPPYIEGKGFCPSALTFLLYSTFFNRNTVNIVEHFISGGQEQPCLDQVGMPKYYAGLSFKELFIGFLRKDKMLALALYRPIGTLGSIVSYVYTNPLPDDVMEDGDVVFVLRSNTT